MPRLSVPSIGGGRKVMRTPSAADEWRGARRRQSAESQIGTAVRSSRLLTQDGTLRIIVPVHVREDVVAPLAVREECLVDLLGAELIVEAGEAEDVVFGALGGVVARGARLHQEGPVTRLRQQE